MITTTVDVNSALLVQPNTALWTADGYYTASYFSHTVVFLDYCDNHTHDISALFSFVLYNCVPLTEQMSTFQGGFTSVFKPVPRVSLDDDRPTV